MERNLEVMGTHDRQFLGELVGTLRKVTEICSRAVITELWGAGSRWGLPSLGCRKEARGLPSS